MKKAKLTGDFITIRFSSIPNLFGDLSVTAIQLVTLILRDCTFHDSDNPIPGSIIIITKPVKESWANELHVTTPSLDNMLLSIRQNGIITKKKSTIYQLDPRRFFKGPSEDQQRVVSDTFKDEDFVVEFKTEE